MGRKLDNAKALYLEGILEGRADEAIAAYSGDRYTQHSTGVADGASPLTSGIPTTTTS